MFVVTIARKPMGRTVAENAMACGTGALNIDATRIEYLNQEDADAAVVPMANFGRGRDGDLPSYRHIGRRGDMFDPSKGRWPANVIIDGDEKVLAEFPETTTGSGVKKKATGSSSGIFDINYIDGCYIPGNSGPASRFFKQVKV